ncbi:helix-turn-helix domain-containing protein [Arenicella xantha]|uniref:Putative transcriptional regulator n=1 Tax=Arenicella xantha TaxID=644221 RepID=A0A395JM78_9GAMM|nr:helix-turn-helix transcriptional regulator [Arenicella xantha]RBP50714.1 putative transcriptional regulator [Arenicella xantha]
MIKCYLDLLLSKRNINAESLIADTSLSRATVRKLLDGSANEIHFDELEALCDYLKCDVGDLLSHQG